jgi:hypothetical protein
MSEYTLNGLIESTARRIKFNIELLEDAEIRGDSVEASRFLSNIKEMVNAIEQAVSEQDAEWLWSNKDW